MLSLTPTWFRFLDFHLGISPFSVRPTPISLHFFGGLIPISTKLDHILSPRLFHLSILASYSSSDGRHLLLSMRRMASGETLKCSARTGVVNLSGCVLCKCRMPSMVSGDSFLRGFHASPPSFSFKASFCTAHAGRSFFRSNSPVRASSTSISGSAFGGSAVGMIDALRGRRASVKNRDCCGCSIGLRAAKSCSEFTKERMKRLSVVLAQLLQVMMGAMFEIRWCSILKVHQIIARTCTSCHRQATNTHFTTNTIIAESNMHRRTE
jgi:hypothetical protein